ncbi:MAG: hypothetical protein IPO81_15470 [Kouleothrix sp.]|nr:hypothetical protein [Kouleothrix sp.]
MFNRALLYLWAMLTLGLLAACGSATSTPGTTAPTGAQPTRAPAPATAAPPPAAATAAGQPTVAAPPTATASGIPEGLTPEGYHVLGRADAPVTLINYSDFL